MQLVRVGRGVHHHHLPAGVLYLSQLVAQPTGVDRPDHRQLGRAAVSPIGSRGLGVEVKDGRIATSRARRDGPMQGQGSLARSSLLADDRHHFHNQFPSRLCSVNDVAISSLFDIVADFIFYWSKRSVRQIAVH